MGHCRVLALACTRGQRVDQQTMKVLFRYLNAMDILLSDPGAWFRKCNANFAD